MAIRSKLRIVGYLVVSILVLLVAFILLVHTVPVRRYVLSKVEQILARQGIQMQARDLRYNLFQGSASAGELVVRSAAAPDLPPVATAERAAVNLGLWDLIQGRYTIENLLLQGPRIHIVRGKDGTDNIPQLSSGGGGGRTEFFVQRARVAGGSLRFEDRAANLDVRLPDWQLTVDGNPATWVQHVEFDLRKPGSVSYEGRELPVDTLRARVDLKPDAAEIKSVRFVAGESRLDASGSLRDFDNPRVQAGANASVALGPLLRFAGITQDLAGQLTLRAQASGPLDGLAVQASASGSGLRYGDFRQLGVEASATYDAGPKLVEISSLDVSSPAGRLSAQGRLSMSPEQESRVRAKIGPLRLARLKTALDTRYTIASTASGTVKAHWPGMQFQSGAGTADLRLTPDRSGVSRNVLPVAGRIHANGDGRNLLLSLDSVTAAEAVLDGRVRLLEQRRLNGEVRLDASDVGRVAAAASAFLGQGQEIQASGPLHAKANIGGTLQLPAVTATVQSAGLNFGGIKGASVDVQADYRGDTVSVPSAVVRWQDQVVRASGTVGLRGAQPIELKAQADSLAVGKVLAGLGMKDIPVQGTVSLAAGGSGSLKQPVVIVTVTGQQLQAYGEPFGQVSVEAQLRDKLLRIDRFRIDKPESGALEASGAYNMDTRTYTADAQARDFRIQNLEIPGSGPLRGTFLLSANGSGSIDNPGVTATVNAANVRVGEIEIGEVAASVNAANQRAKAHAEVPRYGLQATANGGTAAPYPVTVELLARQTDIAKLPVRIGQKVTGTVTATVRGSGAIRNWRSGQATALVENLDLTFNGQPVQTKGPLLASYENRTFTVQPATILAAGSTVRLSGSLPIDAKAGAGSLDVRGTIDLARAMELAPVANRPEAGGELALDATVRGNLEKLDPTGTLRLANARFSTPAFGPPLTDVNFSARLASGAVKIEQASAAWAKASITAGGSVPLGLFAASLPFQMPARKGPAQLTLDVKGLDPGAIKGVPEGTSGRVSLHLEASAPKPDLGAVTAKVTFPELDLRLRGFQLSQEGNSSLSLQNGVARVDRFVLTGPETNLSLSGTAGLEGKRPLNLALKANMDAAVATAFASGFKAQGQTEVQAQIGGTIERPQVNGFLRLAGASFSLPQPSIAAENLDVRLDFTGERMKVTRFAGGLNGGNLTASGDVSYAGGALGNVNLDINAENVYLNYPDGLRTVSNAKLNVRSPNDLIVLGGRATVIEGSYTKPILLEAGLLSQLRSDAPETAPADRNPLLQKVRFNVAVNTRSPLEVDNNLAKLAVTANLRITGTPYRPGATGRIQIEEGGVIRLQEREYAVDRGVITLTSENRIEPSLDIVARTEASGYDITLQVEGDPGDTKTTLTSDPPLPEPDIVAVLLTGRRLEEVRGAGLDVARQQVLSVLAGTAGAALSRQAQSALGLTEVRIEPSLIAAESDPSARLTVGQNLTKDLSLTYSMNLTNSGDQIWIAEYDILRRFVTRAIKQNDNSYRFEFRHDLRFGGPERRNRGGQLEQRRIGSVAFTGNSFFSREQLAAKFGVHPGDRYDFFKVREGLDRLQNIYSRRDLLSSRVRLQRQSTNGTVNLKLELEPGPEVQFVYEGWDPSGDLKDKVREVWRSGVFDLQRAPSAVHEIRNELVKKGYVTAKVEYEISRPQEDRQRVLFQIEPGPRYHDLRIVFEGAESVNPEALRDAIKNQDLVNELYTGPQRVMDFLAGFYRQRGFLDASIDQPRLELNERARTGEVVVPVNEGAHYRMGEVRFEGNTVFTDAELSKAVVVPKGSTYQPDRRQTSIRTIQDMYSNRGFRNAEVRDEFSKRTDSGLVDLTFVISERKQQIVQDIVVQGTNATSRDLVTSQLLLQPGEPLSSIELTRSRRNLYNTGAYTLVDIEPQPVEGIGLQPWQEPIRLRLRVREVQPYQFQYGGFFDTERGPGGTADLSNHNSLGAARILGLRTRYDSRFKEARLYFNQPLLRRFPLKTDATGFLSRDIREGFITDRRGFTAQQETRIGEEGILTYGYRFERTHTFDRNPDPLAPFDVTLRVAPLTTSFSKDTRDDILDATRGSFLSNSLEFAASALGSELHFARYFGQFFKYVPLGRPEEVPWTGGRRKVRFVYAGAVRLGLSGAFGEQTLVPSERFFAGGGTTIRGFAQDRVGPQDPSGIPLGGNALFVINNEVRHSLYSIFDGVAFLDIGNVYPRLKDLNPWKVRKSAGLGLRARTPYFLLRLDYGVKLDRKPGEAFGQLFFSIGQAF